VVHDRWLETYRDNPSESAWPIYLADRIFMAPPLVDPRQSISEAVIASIRDGAHRVMELEKWCFQQADALLEVRGKAEEVCRGHLTPLFTTITNHLQKNIQAGNIRDLNPEIMTLGIALTVFAQPELSKLIEGCHLSKMDSRQVVEAYSQFWLAALLPSSQERSIKAFSPLEELTA